MKKTLTSVLTLAAAGVLLLQLPRASAQEDAPPPPPGAPAGAPGGDWMERMRQRLNEGLKMQLKTTDEEWNIVQPLLEKVETLQAQTLASRFGGMGGGRGPRRGGDDANANGGGNGGGGGNRRERDNAGGGGGNRPERGQRRPGSPEAQALSETLQNESATPEEIKTKLAAVREARKKAATDLASAREDLKKVLNMRQEATLVAAGILD